LWVVSKSSTASISLGTAAVGDGAVTIDYSVDSMPSGSDLLVLVVEGSLAQDVTAGENRGRHLVHENVVRGFAVASESHGTARVQVPDDLDPASSAVVAMLQDRRSMRIVAATRGEIGEALAGLSGTILRSDGSIATGERVYLCNDLLCIPLLSDQRGVFAAEGVPAGTYYLKTQASDGPPVATVSLRARQQLVLEDAITLPD
jgi:hypothetical protein